MPHKKRGKTLIATTPKLRTRVFIIVLLLACIFFAGQAASTSWIVSESEVRFYLNNPEDNGQLEIISAGGRPQFIFRKKIPGGLRLLHYRAGTVGTSGPIQVERALAFDSTSGVLIGDYLPTLQPPADR